MRADGVVEGKEKPDKRADISSAFLSGFGISNVLRIPR